MSLQEENPRQFLEGFRQSRSYANAFAQFLHGKQPPQDVTENELREVFESNDAAKLALILYARDTVALRYAPDYYAESSRIAIENYVAYVRFTFQRMSEGPERDEIADMDRTRSALHGAVARALIAERLAPNEKLGRTLARLILVYYDLDTYESAQQTDIRAIERIYRQHF